MLARAWALALPRLGPGVGLVLAGAGEEGIRSTRDLGYVEAERLPALISGALAWLNPSLYEGSAIGVLEAIACGAPPVVAATGASARAAGRAGIALDAHDVPAWARAMVALATDTELRAGLATAGLKAAAEVRAAGRDPACLLRAVAGTDTAR